MSDVKRFSTAYTASVSGQELSSIDLLVLTPGILSLNGRTVTPPENIDRKMALHYYARMLLIRQLQPIFSDDAIVMSVLDGKSSNIHAKGFNLDNLDLSKPGSFGVPAAATHCQSMTDVMLESFATASGSSQSKKDQLYIHAYPGLVATSITQGMPFYAKPFVSGLFKFVAIQPDVCAENLLSGVVTIRARKSEGRRGNWNLDEKGKVVEKKEAGEELRRKVEEHTWSLIDSQ